MFCKNCGNKLEKGHQFCTECGHPSVFDMSKNEVITHTAINNDRWWHRLLKVAYIFLYIQIIWIVPVVWNLNSSSSSYVLGKYHYEDTYGEAFWYSLLTIIIFITIVRLIKLAVLYVALAQKPQWKKEFKKFF